jgi:hypothetical protein
MVCPSTASFWSFNGAVCFLVFIVKSFLPTCNLVLELWSVQGRYVVTAEFEHRGEANEQQRQVPLTIAESDDQ